MIKWDGEGFHNGEREVEKVANIWDGEFSGVMPAGMGACCLLGQPPSQSVNRPANFGQLVRQTNVANTGKGEFPAGWGGNIALEHKKRGMYYAKSIEGWLSPTIKQPVITGRDHASHPNGMAVGYGQDVLSH